MKNIFYFLLCLSLSACPAGAQKPAVTDRPKNLPDSALLDLVQKQTFRYFWDFGHPVSGLSRERSNVAYNYGNEVVTTGGTGFGVMAIVVATSRKWITREQAVDRLLKMVVFLEQSKQLSWHFSTLAQWGNRKNNSLQQEG